MAKAPKKPTKTPRKKAPSQGASPPKKEKFDTEKFTFNTPIEHIQDALKRLDEQDADPMAEPFTKDEIYWMVVWTEMLPEAIRRKMTHVPCCAKERAVLKLPKLGGKK